ncbi:S41 family peptidase [Streptomyces sp. NPDC093676]
MSQEQRMGYCEVEGEQAHRLTGAECEAVGHRTAGGEAGGAVLTGKRTASSGEAVVVAFRGRPQTRFFGEQTSGVPTGNEMYRLSDGAMLVLTEVKDADRTGRAYDAPIPPDVEIVKDPRPVARNQDEVLQAAQSWLLKQAACRRP